MAQGPFRASVVSGRMVLTAIALLLIVGWLGSPVRPLTVPCGRAGHRSTATRRGLFGTKHGSPVLRRIRDKAAASTA
ncbi:hypothetical protein [Rhodobacter calidifons]|uniref:Secreted protein n=1 Tax=Rhodobacter calidifons TaxID=2715277 RepID=A0ABX0G3I9_9RHOB|nr:hypothetical protein [Rhodobacter calidifons]NHB75790.1 hypothetical protein [Rhodobacter calidifons]